MNRLLQWVLAATLVCGASEFTACSTVCFDMLVRSGNLASGMAHSPPT